MSISRNLTALAVSGSLLVASHFAIAQSLDKGTLAGAKSIKCVFPLMAVGNWGRERPEAKVQPSNLVLQFDSVNTDEGTAELQGAFGKYDIVVRYAGGYLHFIQS